MRTQEQALAVLMCPGERWGWHSVDYSPLQTPFPVPPPSFSAPPPPVAVPVAIAMPPGGRWRIGGLPLPVVIIGALLIPPVVVAILESGAKLTSRQQGTYTSIGSVVWVIEFLVIAGLLARRFFRPQLAKAGYKRAVAQHGAQYALAEQTYREALEQWRGQESAYMTEQDARIAALPTRWAARFRTGPRRIDVYGDPEGWRALTATVGASILGGGVDLLVLDVSCSDVTARLHSVAAAARVSTSITLLPEHAASFDPLADLTSTEVIDVLVEAFTASSEQRNRDERLLVARCLSDVVAGLEGDVTVARLWKALRVGLGMTAASSGAPELTITQSRQMSELFSEDYRIRMGERLIGLEAQLHALKQYGAQAAARSSRPRYECYGLSRKISALEGEILTDFLLQRAIKRATTAGRDGLVCLVVGADRVDPAHLERLEGQTVRSNVRLICCYRALAEDAFERAGRGGAVGFLRLDGAADAARAAEWIGSEHKMVLSELSRSRGRNRSESGGTSWSTTDVLGPTRSWTESSGPGGSSFTTTITPPSRTTGGNTGFSHGETEDEGRSWSRVYEQAVLPDTMRSLPADNCLLVEFVDGRRRVFTVELDPELSYQDGTSAEQIPAQLFAQLGQD